MKERVPPTGSKVATSLHGVSFYNKSILIHKYAAVIQII